MRISDWSSDVCSSDLRQRRRRIAVEVDHVAHLEAAGGGQRRHGDQQGEREGEMAGFHGDSWIPVQRECFSFPSGEGPCLSPSPSRGRACPREGGGRDGDGFCRALDGNPYPPNTSPCRKGLKRVSIGHRNSTRL